MNTVPYLSISSGDFLIVNDLLNVYAEAVRSSIRQSPARDIFVGKIEDLSRRMVVIDVNTTEAIPFVVTKADVGIILSALELFLLLLPSMDSKEELNTFRSARHLYNTLCSNSFV